MLKKSFLSFAFALSVALSPAYAQEVKFMDTVVSFTLPQNYCVLDSSSEFAKFNEASFGSSVKIGLIAGYCSEVAGLKNKERSTLSHYISIEQIGIDKQFVKFTMGDFFYVTLLGAFDTGNLSKYENRVNEKLKAYGVALSDMKLSRVGSSQSSVTYLGNANMSGAWGDLPITLYGSTFLHKNIPLAVHSYDESASADTLKKSMQKVTALINSIK